MLKCEIVPAQCDFLRFDSKNFLLPAAFDHPEPKHSQKTCRFLEQLREKRKIVRMCRIAIVSVVLLFSVAPLFAKDNKDRERT
jgi:hypothetical protein